MLTNVTVAVDGTKIEIIIGLLKQVSTHCLQVSCCFHGTHAYGCSHAHTVSYMYRNGPSCTCIPVWELCMHMGLQYLHGQGPLNFKFRTHSIMYYTIGASTALLDYMIHPNWNIQFT